MLFDFYRYLNYSLPNNGVGDYLNCYSTFLMSRKDLRDNVLKHRMNLLIDIYMNSIDKKINKYDYYNYYLANYNDKYLDRELIANCKKDLDTYDITQDFDSDVRDHYRFMITKNPSEPVIDYDEIDERFYEEELLKEKEKEEMTEIKSYDDYDDDYDYDYYDDYYDDYDYNNDDFDDIEYK